MKKKKNEKKAENNIIKLDIKHKGRCGWDQWSFGGVQLVIQQMLDGVIQKHNITQEDVLVPLARKKHFKVKYLKNGSIKRVTCDAQPILGVAFCGLLMGDVGNRFQSLDVTKGKIVIRQYMETHFSRDINDICLVPDSIYTIDDLCKKPIVFDFHIEKTKGSDFETTIMPLIVLVIPRSSLYA